LLEGEAAPSGRGRTPVPLRLNAAYGCFLGLDFEALRARAVLCDFAGNPLCQEEVPFPSGITRKGVLQKIRSLATHLAGLADRPLLSVGVAAPGQVDCSAGRILHYGLLPDFNDVPLLDHFREAFDVPVFVEDNIRAVAYGEMLRGAGRGRQNFLCLAVRSGVGLGIIINGKLYSGAGTFAGEVGYTVFPTGDGPQAMTDLISAKGFVEETLRLLRSRQGAARRQALLDKGNDLSLGDIVAAAEAGDELLQDRLELLGTHLGMVTANLANLFSPEIIVLAGEVPGCCELVRRTVERTFRKFTLPQILEIASLQTGSLGNYAGALGAAYLGFARIHPEDETTLVNQRKKQNRRAAPQKAPIAK
ncbi:MAG: ROK family protein, partial [Thermoguttaceae bacterium]